MDPLITAGDLRDYLQRPVDDAAALLAVAGASGAVRSYCRWVLTEELEATLHAAGTGSRVLGLPTLMLTAVTAVRVDGELLDEEDYQWAQRGQLYRPAPACWPLWSRIEVDCDHGYPAAPDAVQIVALGVAARYLSNPESLRDATTATVTRTYTLGFTELEAALLAEYRL